MVQATSPDRRSGQGGSARGARGDYRVGASHDAPARAASTPVSAGGGKLPPITWRRTDYRKIMVADLKGAGSSLVLAVLLVSALTFAGMLIAIGVTTVLGALGFDPSSLY